MRFQVGSFAAALVLAGCTAAPPAPTVHDLMAGTVAPQAQVLWDVSNRAMNGDGDADGSKLSADDWTKLTGASDALREAALTLSSIDKPRVVQPGQKIDDEGETDAATGAQVQGFIDEDRGAFRTRAAALEVIAGDFRAASTTRDAERLMSAAGRLDEVCEACHQKFWYPQEAGKK